jgi:hypothetical protein
MVVGAGFLFLHMMVIKGLSYWLMLVLRCSAQVRFLVRFPQISRGFYRCGAVGVVLFRVAGRAAGVALSVGLPCGLLCSAVVSCWHTFWSLVVMLATCISSSRI